MATQPLQEDILLGQAIYTRKSLPLYDLFVTKFSNRFAWRCPRQNLLDFFNTYITANHLDIGVGTGYFLEKLHLIPRNQRIALLDLNKDCLAYAQKKLQKFHPEIYHQDIFQPFLGITKKFDSISLNYVLHCLPGDLPQKAIAFDHIKAVLNENGKVFGTTILGDEIKKNWLASKLMTVYNQKKFFGNINDSRETLLDELNKRFDHVTVTIKGCVAFFVGKL